MIFPRWYKFACPYCRHVYARSQSCILLGPGARHCKKCRHRFFDDYIEWPAASPKQKREYLFPERAVAYFAANVLLGVALALAARPYSRDELAVATFFAGFASLPLLARLLRCAFEIRHSTNCRETARRLEAVYTSGSVAGSWPR